MSVSVPKLFKNQKLSISVRQTKKRSVIYIFDSHFVFRSLEGGCRGHFGFFQNLLVNNVYSWSIKLLQISRIIGSVFSGIILKKRRTYWIWRSNQGHFFLKTLNVNFSYTNPPETLNYAFMCDKSKKIQGFIYFLAAILGLLIWRWRLPNIEFYPTDSNSAHPNYVKTSG